MKNITVLTIIDDDRNVINQMIFEAGDHYILAQCFVNFFLDVIEQKSEHDYIIRRNGEKFFVRIHEEIDYGSNS